MQNFKEQINQYASEFLLSENKDKKSSILAKASELISYLNYTEISSKTYKELGFSYLLGRNSSSKIEKSLKENIDSYALYLSASNNSGFELCSFASKFCRQICLVESGRSMMEQKNGNIHKSRLIKTWLYFCNRQLFFLLLDYELERARSRYIKTGIKFCVRLNGTSDLDFFDVYNLNKDIQFYDYTKNPKFMIDLNLSNHHQTFSFSGSNFAHSRQAIKNGLNLAVPVLKDDFKKILGEFKNTFNGDITDLRYKDKQTSSICLLSVKGRHKDTSSFLLDYNSFKELYTKLYK